jgi:hypothetical protein
LQEEAMGVCAELVFVELVFVELVLVELELVLDLLDEDEDGDIDAEVDIVDRVDDEDVVVLTQDKS